MSVQAATDARAQRAALANVRQALGAPVEALVGYGELICGGLADELADLKPDAERILSAARDLSGQVNRLLEDDTSQELFGSQSVGEAEKLLRHDLRTPINAIKGYGEMLLEDLEDMGEGVLRPDLEKLLAEADRLLGQLGSIVDFSRGDLGDAGARLGADAAAVLDDLVAHAREDDDAPPEETGRILVVDDIESNRDLLGRRLLTDGHQVAMAESGEEALDMLAGGDFDLVLLDLMMPGLNGYEVLAHMKGDPRLKGLPVVMVSALDETSSVIRCIEAGADDYLPKPVNPTLLRARIRAGLEKKHWLDEEQRQKRFVREAFSRFVAPAVVDQLIEDPERLSLGGRRQDITVVFTDLAGFTALIEGAEPARVLPVLNRYLDGLCSLVRDHDGTIDKIVGDALHAFFGAPLEQPDHPVRAMNCVAALDAFSEEFRRQPEARELGFGLTRIGVHSGSAVVGNFGGEAFFDYTAHGDVVNTAARMESVNKQLGTRICVSGVTAAGCPDVDFRPVGTLVLVGKGDGIEAFEPFQEASDSYAEAFALLAADADGAAEAFSQVATASPDDPLAAFHSRRLANGERGPVIVLSEK
ncbi:MAG: adenylate cyclase [Rhodospirillaceae bacterium]|nr:adenylate cyclase [Rhodospirillaceae bacterium]MDP6623663.1 response regulator [Alphaproteobacteria bacterium]